MKAGTYGAVIASIVAVMALAQAGRAGDWSPFALALSGWALGTIVGAWIALREVRR